MFTHNCESCERRQLIFPDQITGLTNVDNGFRIEFTCWCDTVQTHLVERLAVAA